MTTDRQSEKEFQKAKDSRGDFPEVVLLEVEMGESRGWWREQSRAER